MTSSELKERLEALGIASKETLVGSGVVEVRATLPERGYLTTIYLQSAPSWHADHARTVLLQAVRASLARGT